MTSAGFGYLAPFVAIVGATVGANLALIALDIVWDRSAHDRVAGTDAAEALGSRPPVDGQPGRVRFPRAFGLAGTQHVAAR